jgi:hypothetical protein
MLFIFILNLPANNFDSYTMSVLPFVSSEATPGKLYRHILKFMSWPNIVRYKKHKGISHCNDIPKNINTFRKAWLGISGIASR